jgi:glucuronoarabinoxylan endo-1,4-beta-xylanase
MSKNTTIKINALLIFLLALSANSTAQVANIDAGNVKQTIDGFGASTAWHGQLSDQEADAAFKNETDDQMGLSILRIRIDENGNYNDELINARKAIAQGAIIFAAPWDAPAVMVERVGDIKRIRYDMYDVYAQYLDYFVSYMSQHGAPLYCISIQNEPDWNGGWNQWTSGEMLTFMRDYAYLITGTKIMAPESFQFRHEMSDPILNDPIACENLDIVGGHIYGAGLASYPLAEEKGKKVWMTEHFINEDDITTCINQFAKEIIDCMYDNMNAFIWWYLRQPDCNLINTDGSLRRKGYTMAHFSKFIRPGYQRIDATYRPQSGVYMVAFKGKEIVIVIINSSTSPKEQTVTFSGVSIPRVKRYTTTGYSNLSNDGIIVVTDNTFSAALPAMSITTFVGTDTSIAVEQQRYHLEQNYPNPFNLMTNISFNITESAEISLIIYDVLGREVAVLVNDILPADMYTITWDARYSGGAKAASGIYFYRLDAGNGNHVNTKKMLLIK